VHCIDWWCAAIATAIIGIDGMQGEAKVVIQEGDGKLGPLGIRRRQRRRRRRRVSAAAAAAAAGFIGGALMRSKARAE